MKIEPIDLRKLDEETSNIYEAVIVAAKRARQINDEMKIEFNAMLSTVPASGTDDESEDIENPAQLKISLDFERREKPHLKALDELQKSKLEYYYKNKNH